MKGTDDQRRQRFDALFAAYGPDIVAYCGASLAGSARPRDREVLLLAEWEDLTPTQMRRCWGASP